MNRSAMLSNGTVHGAEVSKAPRRDCAPAATVSRTSWTLFEEPLWLDSIAPGAWGAVEVVESGEVVGRLPYVEIRRFGFSALSNPPLTPWLGPWIRNRGSRYDRNIGYQHEVLRQLVQGLPKASMIKIFCAPEFTNIHALHADGFDLGLLYTYRIEDLTDIDRIWRNLKGNARNACRMAEKQLRVTEEANLPAVISNIEKVYKHRGMDSRGILSALERVDEKLSHHNCRRIYVARDARDRIHGALYTIFDERHTFTLAGGADPALRASRADTLLTWTAIKDAATTSRVFDFLGSMIPSVEMFVRGFGSRQAPQYLAKKQSRLLACAQMLRRVA